MSRHAKKHTYGELHTSTWIDGPTSQLIVHVGCVDATAPTPTPSKQCRTPHPLLLVAPPHSNLFTIQSPVLYIYSLNFTGHSIFLTVIPRFFRIAGRRRAVERRAASGFCFLGVPGGRRWRWCARSDLNASGWQWLDNP